MANNNQKNNGNNQQQSTKKDPLRIYIEDPASFTDDTEKFTRYMTTKEFCERIVNPIFKGTFRDFDGSYCQLVNTDKGPKIFVDLNFSKSGQISNAKYFALVEKSTKTSNGTDTFSKIQALNSKLNSTKIFDLTPEGEEILSEFVPGVKNIKDIKWAQRMVETSEKSFSGITSTNVKIAMLDPLPMLKKYYGTRIKLGNKVTDKQAIYDIRAIKPIQNGYSPNPEILLELACYDRANSERAIMSLGGSPVYNTAPMYRA